MERKNSKELLKKVRNLELELKLEKKKRELESLEHEREKEKLREEIEKLKEGLEVRRSAKSRIGVKSEIRVVRKRSRRESSSSERDDEYMSAEEQSKERERRIVLKRGRKAENITPERWMNENFEEVQYSSVKKRAPGVYILWLEKAEDREKILEESKGLEKWEEYYVEKWLSMEEWIEKQKEKGDRAREKEERESKSNRREW